MVAHPALRDLLERGPFGHLVTLDADGTPHVTLCWAGLDGDVLVFATFPDQHKLASIRRDPRVVISFQDPHHSGETLHPYAVVEGHGRVTEGGALAWMDRLAPHYLGAGQEFPWRDAPPGFVTRVTITRVYGVGPWA